MDLKGAAKNQLKKTLNYLRREELAKIDKIFEAKQEIKMVENVMINGKDPENRKRSLIDNEVNMKIHAEHCIF